MKEFLKIGSLTLAVVLTIVSVLLISSGSLAGIFGIATIILTVYYLIIYLTILHLKKSNKGNSFIYNLLFVLFLIPLVWLSIDSESLINLLMYGVTLDMK